MVGTDSHGHSVVIGMAPGTDTRVGVKASDLLLMAAAACSMYDVVDILTKQQEPLEKLTIECTGDQLPDPPNTFTRINLHYIAKGAVTPEKLGRAIRLSEDKYCSVINTLRPGTSIHSNYEIVP
jgi:putative redox protein